MAFTPPTSLASSVISGTVAVSSVSGTVAISAASLPLPDGAATEETLAAAAESLDDVGLTAILQRERIEVAA